MKLIRRARDENYTNRPHKEPPIDFAVNEKMRAWAAEKVPGVDIDEETDSFCDCEFPTPHKNWTATWRNWMRREQKAINKQQSNRDFYAGKLQKPVTQEQSRKEIDSIAELVGMPAGTDSEIVLAANQKRIERLLN